MSSCTDLYAKLSDLGRAHQTWLTVETNPATAGLSGVDREGLSKEMADFHEKQAAHPCFKSLAGRADLAPALKSCGEEYQFVMKMKSQGKWPSPATAK